MKIMIEIEASPADEKLLRNLSVHDLIKAALVKTEVVQGECPVPGEDGPGTIGVPISLEFDWLYCTRRKKNVPHLVNLWLKGYGWLRGGSRRGEARVECEIPFPEPIGKVIIENNYLQHGALPIMTTGR